MLSCEFLFRLFRRVQSALRKPARSSRVSIVSCLTCIVPVLRLTSWFPLGWYPLAIRAFAKRFANAGTGLDSSADLITVVFHFSRGIPIHECDVILEWRYFPAVFEVVFVAYLFFTGRISDGASQRYGINFFLPFSL